MRSLRAPRADGSVTQHRSRKSMQGRSACPVPRRATWDAGHVFSPARCIAPGDALEPSSADAETVYAQSDASEPLLACFEAAREVEAFVTEAGVMVTEVEEDDAQFDCMGESKVGGLHLVARAAGARELMQRMHATDVFKLFGCDTVAEICAANTSKLRAACQDILGEMDVPPSFPLGNPERAVYCSRTLNMRAIKAIGYDMDYTLIHYDTMAWEGRAYTYGLEALRSQGVPVEGLRFDPGLVIRGLIVDKETGNLIKVDRFGLVKRAMHGTRMLTWQEIRKAYGREVVNLRNEGRWVFLNTLFSVSEAVMYAQLVDRLDQGYMFGGASNGAPYGSMSYQHLYRLVSKALYRTHVEGKLKAEIIQNPGAYVELDPQVATTLLDQKDSGKMLLLITNSDYEYTHRLMSFAYDRFLPNGQTWRDLFDMVIVCARKPDFFCSNMSLYEVVTEDGLMRPAMAARRGGLYSGGSAHMVEKALGVVGDDILYVGDHIYTDAALAKVNFRWRTALIIRELEAEIAALAEGRPHRQRLKDLMAKKEVVGDLFNHLRLGRQRLVGARGEQGGGAEGAGSSRATAEEESLNEALAALLMVLGRLDDQIAPSLERDGSHFNERWGYLSRAGFNDKSQLCRQIEKYADVYTSRVSNFLNYTPYMYFRSPSQSLAHDRNLTAYYNRVQRALSQQQAAAAAASADSRVVGDSASGSFDSDDAPTSAAALEAAGATLLAQDLRRAGGEAPSPLWEAAEGYDDPEGVASEEDAPPAPPSAAPPAAAAPSAARR